MGFTTNARFVAKKRIMPLVSPLVEGTLEAGFKYPELGLKPISTVIYRPLGKSSLLPAPWYDGTNDSYVPSEMAARNMKIGLEKIKEVKQLYPDWLLDKAFNYCVNKLKPIWGRKPDSLIMTFDEAVETLDKSKSPGYPYFYRHQTKEDVLSDPDSLQQLKNATNSFLMGDQVESFFALTLKSELRDAQKVKEGKTRVFMASDMHHLLASKILYEKQNNLLMETIGRHPFTIGISIPGPQFTRTVTRLGTKLNDGDVSGNDLRFNLQVANRIREMRHAFLPGEYYGAGYALYNATFCGHGVVWGAVYPLPNQKSGSLNTATDNSLQTWFSLVMASYLAHPNKEPDEVFDCLINSDDLLVHQKIGSFKQLCDVLRPYNMIIEADNWTPRPPNEVVFLSHHLEEVFVTGFGDIVVAAGNLPKLLSSINWVKNSKELTFEESCLAHLLGIRICLFPWKLEFDRIEEIIDLFLKDLVCTPVMNQLLKARLTIDEIAQLHVRYEGFVFSQYEQRARTSFGKLRKNARREWLIFYGKNKEHFLQRADKDVEFCQVLKELDPPDKKTHVKITRNGKKISSVQTKSSPATSSKSQGQSHSPAQGHGGATSN